jgi:hypothetical protein
MSWARGECLLDGLLGGLFYVGMDNAFCKEVSV